MCLIFIPFSYGSSINDLNLARPNMYIHTILEEHEREPGKTGALTNLQTLDLDGNVANALDRVVIDDAVNLNTLFFDGNLCASNYFGNFRHITETVTEGDDEFSFFEGPYPGIFFLSDDEIFIGATNNTTSVIRVNQQTNVATVPTSNIIARNQWNDFRIAWANQVVLVYSGNDTLPFMACTMEDFFPVNFYELRAVETSASWSVQPFEL